MSAPSSSAYLHFVEAFDRLTAMVRQRLELECRYHQRSDLRQFGQELPDYAVEFGRLLRVVFRYGLEGALTDEATWYAAVLRSRGPKQDAFSLLLDSWIFAIQGVIRPPECNDLAQPLQTLRADLPRVLEMAQQRYATPPAAETVVLVERLTEGDVGGAQKILQSLLQAGRQPTDVITGLLLPAMREVGRRWENNELPIFREHLATETTRRLLAALAIPAGVIEPAGRKALVSCVAMDEHQLLPLALGVYLELRGWQVRSLGGGLPAADIAAAVAAFSPAALFLSLSMLSRLHEALDTIACVRAETSACKIIVGGLGTTAARGPLEHSGAKVAASFDEAHRAALEEAPLA